MVCESVPKTVSGYSERPSRRCLAADDAREVLDVHLMDDSSFRWNHAEVAERRLAPSKEHVPLAIALVLEVGVERERVGPAEVIHLHRVIDDELHRLQRIHLLRIPAELRDAVSHRREVHDAWNAGEILQEDARGHEGDLLVPGRPACQRADVVGPHERVVLATQQVLEQDFQRERQAPNAREFLLDGRQREVIE